MVGWCGILGATTAWAATDFVVLGHEGIWVRQGSTVVSGDVGANVASVGPFLASDQEVTIGKNVVVQDPTSRVLGDTMRLKSGVPGTGCVRQYPQRVRTDFGDAYDARGFSVGLGFSTRAAGVAGRARS